jgi:hypothetical protein
MVASFRSAKKRPNPVQCCKAGLENACTQAIWAAQAGHKNNTLKLRVWLTGGNSFFAFTIVKFERFVYCLHYSNSSNALYSTILKSTQLLVILF